MKNASHSTRYHLVVIIHQTVPEDILVHLLMMDPRDTGDLTEVVSEGCGEDGADGHIMDLEMNMEILCLHLLRLDQDLGSGETRVILDCDTNTRMRR